MMCWSLLWRIRANQGLWETKPHLWRKGSSCFQILIDSDIKWRIWWKGWWWWNQTRWMNQSLQDHSWKDFGVLHFLKFHIFQSTIYLRIRLDFSRANLQKRQHPHLTFPCFRKILSNSFDHFQDKVGYFCGKKKVLKNVFESFSNLQLPFKFAPFFFCKIYEKLTRYPVSYSKAFDV